jgi:hypothetical protein
MDSNNFEVLMGEIFRHKQIMEHLQEENRELRRQLTDLHEARGMILDICGRHFVMTRAWTPPPTLISPHTPPPTFLDEMMGQSAPPSTAFLSQEAAGTLSAQHRQRTKEVEQRVLQGQLVDSFLLE